MSAQQHVKLWRQGHLPLLEVVYSWMLGQLAQKLDVIPGAEFRVALEEAIKVISASPKLLTRQYNPGWGQSGEPAIP